MKKNLLRKRPDALTSDTASALAEAPAASTLPVPALADADRVFLPGERPEAVGDLPEPPPVPVAPVTAAVVEAAAIPTMPRLTAVATVDSAHHEVSEQALSRAAALMAHRHPLTSPDPAYRYARDVKPFAADLAWQHMKSGGALDALTDTDLGLIQIGVDQYDLLVADLAAAQA